MTDHSLVVFLVASLVLAATPGPGVIYIVARTLAQGRRAGLASVGGVALGNLCNALVASLGLAALFAASSAAFTVVRLAGALYLVWLGVAALRPRPAPEPGALPPVPAIARVFRDGFVVALLNPKTALFFAAFLPQFIDPAASPLGPTLRLGGCFVVIAASTDAIYVLVAGAAARAFTGCTRASALARRAGGLVLIGLGIAAACTSSRPAR